MKLGVGQSIWRFYNLFVCAIALVWRRLLSRTTFIAITGSLGKTTTKECLAAILSSRFPTVKTIGTSNGRRGLPRTILRARPRHRFVVLEVGIDQPGVMWRSAWLVRPDIAVILRVARTHTKNFPTLEVTAAEKARLLGRLPPSGVAVLNGDDPRVAAMANRQRFRVSLFGTSPAFDIWAEQISSKWPARLEFNVRTDTQSHRVRTQLLGVHWAPAVVAALAAAQCCGISLKEASKALQNVEPVVARMQPILLPVGATIIRDEFNGTVDTVDPALRFLEEARAARRLLIVSDFQDSRTEYSDRLSHLGKQAPRVAEVAVFVGENSAYGRKVAIEAGMRPGNVHSFLQDEQAAEFLKSELGPGDLVLLKGRIRDHLSRIFFAQLGTVKCWKLKCDKTILCDDCPELGFRPHPVAEPLPVEMLAQR